jgi:hypothetical protein
MRGRSWRRERNWEGVEIKWGKETSEMFYL